MSQPTTAGPTQLTPEWQAWVAENALGGVDAATIIGGMLANGFDEATATREVHTAVQHPYVKAGLGAIEKAKAIGVARAGTGFARADKYAWILEVIRRAAQLSSTYGTVPRVKSPSKEEFLEEFYARNRPVVIEGDMEDWAAIGKWDGEFLKDGGRSELPVSIEVFRDPEGPYKSDSPRIEQQMRFGDVVDTVEAGDTSRGIYMTANTTKKNQDLMKELWGDITYPEYLDGDHEIGKGLFWYGPEGTLTPIHHDLTNNLMAQVRGRKHIKLIAPFETADVYNDRNRYSPVDIEAPDFATYPDFEKVTVLDVEIGPGEMLFVPAGWWHGVRSLDTSITFTFMNFAYETDFYSTYNTFEAID